MGTCFAVLALLQQPQPQAFLEPNDRFLQHFSGHNPSPGWPMQQKSGQQHEQLPPSRHAGFAAQFVPCIHFIKSCFNADRNAPFNMNGMVLKTWAGWGNTFFNSRNQGLRTHPVCHAATPGWAHLVLWAFHQRPRQSRTPQLC